MAGGWTNDQLDELVAPTGTPFVPGNNVVGFGTTLPDELVAAGYLNAIVFYSSSWNAAATTFTVKFRFIAVANNDLIIGYGYCANPSVSQVATIVTALVVTLNTGLNDNEVNIDYVTGQSMFNVSGVSGDVQMHLASQTAALLGGVSLLTSGDTGFSQLGDDTTNGGFIGAGNVYLLGGVGANPTIRLIAQRTFDNTATLVSDTGWTSIPLTNSWVSDAAWPAAYRKMPDGTVAFKGHITKVAAPASGENWMAGLPTAYRPLQPVEILAPCGTRAYNNSANGQAVKFATNGTALVFDCATTLSGDIVLDPVRYPVI